MRLLGKNSSSPVKPFEERCKTVKARENGLPASHFDMLGEAAYTEEDANRYYNDYVPAIHAIGKDAAAGAFTKGAVFPSNFPPSTHATTRPTRTRDERTVAAPERIVPFG